MQNQNEQAISVYREMLVRQPQNYNAMSKIIQVLRRTGKVEEIKEIIEEAESKRGKLGEAGLNFCKGIYYRTIGKV